MAMRFEKDPLLWFADPIFNGSGRNAPAGDEKLDQEIEKLADSSTSRFRWTVAIAKPKLIDGLRAALRSGRVN